MLLLILRASFLSFVESSTEFGMELVVIIFLREYLVHQHESFVLSYGVC